MALLDSGCTKTVCGKTWLEHFLHSLSFEEYKQIENFQSDNSFKFGDSKIIKSLKKVKIPVIIAGVKATITTDVVEYEIPLLLSKEAMKKAQTQIDFKEDKVNIFGQKVKIYFTSTGHYCIKLKSKPSDKNSFKSNAVFLCNDIEKLSNTQKYKVALKLHRQFSHPHSERLLNLLQDCEINDQELKSHIKDLDESCEICVKYKKTKPRPIVGFPLAETFNETIAMDLKEWSHEKKIWLLHMIDHCTRYSVSCVITSKKKELIVKKIFQHWIGTFGYPNKILVDNGGEFDNGEFQTLCENFNIRICTTAAESPWSNGLIERHNAILGLTVTKTIEDTKCDLQLAVSWAVSAKNSLKNVHGFSPNQLVFGKNPNFPNVCDDLLPALENKTTSEIVAQNLNALHFARQNYMKSESSSKIKQALKHQVRTFSDVIYNTGDIIYYKRKDNSSWSGPASVIGKDGQQVLVKHGSRYIRVHPCNLQLRSSIVLEKRDMSHNDIGSPASDKEKGPNNLNNDFGNLKILYENENMYPLNNELDKNESIQNLEDITDNVENPQNLEHNNLDQNDEIYYNNEKHPKIKDFVEYKILGSDDFHTAQIISRAGKTSGKYSNWYNIKKLSDNTLNSIDWKTIDKWKNHSHEEVLINVQEKYGHENFSEFDITNAKLDELNKWKENKVYDTFNDCDEKFIDLRWVLSEKSINGELKVKARLVAKGFQEENPDVLSDSPTCTKESMRLILNIVASKRWLCWSIDIKAAFLQNRNIGRIIYVKPPKEANCKSNTLWKLNTTIYGLNDASRSWYLKVRTSRFRCHSMSI